MDLFIIKCSNITKVQILIEVFQNLEKQKINKKRIKNNFENGKKLKMKNSENKMWV